MSPHSAAMRVLGVLGGRLRVWRRVQGGPRIGRPRRTRRRPPRPGRALDGASAPIRALLAFHALAPRRFVRPSAGSAAHPPPPEGDRPPSLFPTDNIPPAPPLLHMMCRWFDELGHYERTLEAMSRAKRDDNFREELRAIEQWFTVLSDAERIAALHSLLQHANYVQLRFLMMVLQKLLKEHEKDGGMRGMPGQGAERGPGAIGSNRYRQRLFDRHSAPNVEEQYYRYLANLDSAPGPGPVNPPGRPSSIHERPPSYHERPSSYHEVNRPPSIHDPIPSGNGSSRPPSFHETSTRPLSFHESSLNRPLSFHESTGFAAPRPFQDRPASFHETSSALAAQQILSSNLFDDFPSTGNRRHSTVSLYAPGPSANPSRMRNQADVMVQAPYPVKALDPLLESQSEAGSPSAPYFKRGSPIDGAPAPRGGFDEGMWGSGVYNLRERLIGGLRERTAKGGNGYGYGNVGGMSGYGGVIGSQGESDGFPGNVDWANRPGVGEIAGDSGGLPFPAGPFPPPSTSPRPTSVPSSPVWRPPSTSSPARGSSTRSNLGDPSDDGAFEGENLFPSGTGGTRFRPNEHIEVDQLQDIPSWLRSLRLHKYTSLFENISWKEMIKLTEEELEARGVSAMGARKKLLRVFSLIRQGVEHQDSPQAGQPGQPALAAPPTPSS
ncbi:hypothetical protein DFJ74DRAFT_653943 [Hyaloraphidium curvatum]|nr:hypothetical protein DFJ74DRAFT_653943 [Hyaloraphidium curvatum]